MLHKTDVLRVIPYYKSLETNIYTNTPEENIARNEMKAASNNKKPYVEILKKEHLRIGKK